MTASSTVRPTAPFHDSGDDRVALVILDMINCFDFEGADLLAPRAQQAANAIRFLRDQADAAQCPVIYVNDNFGEWHSEASKLVQQAIDANSPTARLLKPRGEDYFIIKPQYSGFYSTNLGVLLPKLGVRRLMLTGIAADMCVLFTAADAAMRDYALWVPSDAIAADTQEKHDAALSIMERATKAEVRSTTDLTLAEWDRTSHGGQRAD